MDSADVTGGRILGGKTGYTGEAGQCLASLTQINGRGYILVTAMAEYARYRAIPYPGCAECVQSDRECWDVTKEEYLKQHPHGAEATAAKRAREEAVGVTADMDERFSNGKLIPPGHPQCRCVVDYVEIPVIVPKPVDNGSGDGIIKTDKQFGKKIGKYAKDYSLDPSNPDDRQIMNRIIDEIYDSPDEV